MSRPRTTPQPRPRGSVHRDEVLSLAEFRSRTGFGHKSIASAKRAGLRVIHFGRLGFVRGVDALEFFAKLAEEQGQEGAGK